jgi:hypothetical protein
MYAIPYPNFLCNSYILCLFTMFCATLPTCSFIMHHPVDWRKRGWWLRLKKIWMCLTFRICCLWKVSDIEHSKFSAKGQGGTYPRVGSSFLFLNQGGQTHIPSWWKKTWKMEGRIRRDEELFLLYEVDHLYHWYGLLLSFSPFETHKWFFFYYYE